MPSLYVLSTKTDRAFRSELVKLATPALDPVWTVESVEWPTSVLPWLTLKGDFAVIVPITRTAIEREAGWAQALTSRHIDQTRTIVIFLKGLEPASIPHIEFHDATTLVTPALADGAQQLISTLRTLRLGATLRDVADMPRFDLRNIIGRQHDLERALVLTNAHPRSLAIVGLGGQGKTAFAAKLTHELASRYTNICWTSLRNRPTLDWVAQRLAQRVGAQISVADATVETATANILRVISDNQVLLILDNADSVFGSRTTAPPENTQDLSARYEYFFQALAESQNSSLVLITSREVPNAFRAFSESLRVFRLPGLSDATVEQLMRNSGIEVDSETVRLIQNRFLGNPLAVKLLCGLYADHSTGGFMRVLGDESTSIEDLTLLMDEHVARLSATERLILGRIAWEGEALARSDLRQMAWPADTDTMTSRLNRLMHMLLVNSEGERVSVSHPLLREHMVEWIKREVKLAFLVANDAIPPVLSAMLLVNPFADDRVRSRQIDAVSSIAADIRRNLGTRAAIKERILRYVDCARAAQQSGYALANLVEVSRRAGVDLKRSDFSGLPLEHVDFRDIDIRETDCSYAAFRSCEFGGNFGPVTATARLPGKQELLAAGTFEGFIRVWTSTGDLRLAIKCADDWISAITPSREPGKAYFSAVDGMLGCVEWDSCTITPITRVDTQIRGLARVGDWLVAACADGSLRIVDVADGCTEKVPLAEHRLKVVRLDPAGSDRSVLVGGDSGDLVFFDVPSRRVAARLRNGTAWVRDALFSTNGQSLFTSDDDGKVRVWARDIGEAFQLRGLVGHSHRVWCLAFDETSGRLYSAGNDSVIRVWDSASLKQVDLYEGHGSWIRAMSLLEAGQVLVSGSEDQTLRFWRSASGGCFRTRTGYAQRVFSLAFASEEVLLCGTGDHKVVRFHLASELGRSTYFEGHRDQVFKVTVERRANRVASASDDGEVRIWNLSSGDSVFAQRLHTGWIGALRFSPAGLRLISGGDDRTMIVLDAVHLTPLARRRTHEGRISDIAFVHETSVVCTSEDGTVRMLEVPSLRELWSFQLHSGPLYAVGVAGSQSCAIAVGVNGKVWCIDITGRISPSVVTELPVNAIWSLAVSPDGEVVALGGDDGNVTLLRLVDGRIVTVRGAHERQVWSVAWSPSGSVFGTASEDGRIALWDASGQSITRLSPPPQYHGFRITGAEGLSPAERHLLLSMGAQQ